MLRSMYKILISKIKEVWDKIMNHNVDYEYTISNIVGYKEALSAMLKNISNHDDFIINYKDSLNIIINGVSQNKSVISKDKNEKDIKRVNAFFQGVSCVFRIDNFICLCNCLKRNKQIDDAIYTLKRKFISALCEFDIYLYTNKKEISEITALLNKNFLITEIVGRVATTEYSFMTENGERKNILPFICLLSFENDNDEMSNNENDLCNDVHDDSKENDLIKADEFLFRKFSIESSQKLRSFLQLLYNFEKNEKLCFSFDDKKKIEKWDKNCLDIINNLYNDEKSVFEQIVNSLFVKLQYNGHIEKICVFDEATDFNDIIQYMEQNNFKWDKVTVLMNIENMGLYFNVAEIKNLKMIPKVKECGYRFTQEKSKNKTFYDYETIRNPEILLSRPYLFRYIPEEIGDQLIILYYYINNLKSNIPYETIEGIKSFINKHCVFFSTLYSSQISFVNYLEVEYKTLITIDDHNEWLYNGLIKICNDIGLGTPLDLNVWVNQKEIDVIKTSKNHMIRSTDECREYKYVNDQIDGYSFDKPLMVVRVPIMFAENNGRQNIIHARYHVVEFLSRKELFGDKNLSENECNIIELMLNDDYIEFNDMEFENYIKENRVMDVLSSLYDKPGFMDRCYDFINHKIFIIRKYVLLNPFDKKNVKSEVNYIGTADKEKDNTCQGMSFGLLKDEEILYSPKINTYKYSPILLLEKMIQFIDDIIKLTETTEHTSTIRKLVESLIKNNRILEGVSLDEFDTQKKKEWVLRNESISFLFEKEISEEISKFKEICSLTKLTIKTDEIEHYLKHFSNEWKITVDTLSKYGIALVNIVPHKTIITDKELAKGWIVRNENNKYSIKPDEDRLVYGIIQQGIEVDGTIIREPIVNAYSYTEDHNEINLN